jgi:hypothetical protein
MIVAWWFFIGSLVLLIGAGIAYLRSDDNGYLILVAGIAALAVLLFGISGLVVSLGRHYGRVACRTFSAQTARPTKFVIYTAWDGGDCLTPDGSGHWIPTKNLREFGSKP